MVTTLEDLSVELFYEIFIYFQVHEIFNIFSDLNSRITTIIENLSSISVYLGFSGLNIEVTHFYYKYLSQTNISTRVTSLCVSDTFSIDNGLWFAQHGSIFINLRHLSLIDIKRSTFEMILNSLLRIDSLIMFSVHFVLTDDRAALTFAAVPEGAYHERIFRLFPSLHVCHLLFGRYKRYSRCDLFVPSVNESFMLIKSNLLKLQSLTLRYCLPRFLSHLFEHLPQLEQFTCHLYDTSWIPQQHPVKRYHK